MRVVSNMAASGGNDDQLSVRNGWHRAAVVIILAFLPFVAYSQELADSLSFNALEFSMQKRYRPTNAEFVSEKFTDNTFLRLHAGAWSLFSNSVSGYSQGPVAGLSFGKMLNRFNALSLGLSAGEFRRNTDGVRVWNAGGDITHSFDLTSYFCGYDPSRILRVSTAEGAGFELLRSSGGYGLAVRFFVGLEFSAQVARDLDLFFRPSLMLGTDALDRLSSPAGCHGGYSMDFGLTAHFNRFRLSSAAERESFGQWFVRDAFISVSGGAQFQASDLVSETVGFLPSARESLEVSYGRLLTGPLSARLSAFYGRDVWKAFSDGRQRDCRYGGLRGELMFDPMFWHKGGKGVFSMPLLLGPEAGLMFKPDDGYTIRRLYLGLTGGVQLRFNVARHFGLFLEPHFSLVPYSWKSRSGNALVTSLANWYDVLYSLRLGVNIPL